MKYCCNEAAIIIVGVACLMFVVVLATQCEAAVRRNDGKIIHEDGGMEDHERFANYGIPVHGRIVDDRNMRIHENRSSNNLGVEQMKSATRNVGSAIRSRVRRMLGHRTNCFYEIKKFCQLFSTKEVSKVFCLDVPITKCYALD